MKKIIFTSALLLCTAMGFSQQMPERKPLTAEQIAQRQANALSQRLSLTEDQRSKAYTIYLDKAKKNLVAREALMKEIQKQRDRATAEAKQQNDKISQLLNADQKKTYQDMQTQLRNRVAVPGGPQMRQGPQQQGQGFQRGPGGRQFQRPGNPSSRFQPGQGRQLQRPNMPPNFQGRPGGQGGFQNGGQGGQNFRLQLLQRRFQRLQRLRRMNGFQQQPGATQTIPNNNQAKPADNSK